MDEVKAFLRHLHEIYSMKEKVREVVAPVGEKA